MKLTHKLLLNRIQAPSELSATERLQLAHQPGLAATLAHNRALAKLGQSELEPPARAAMLARVYELSGTTQENKMTLIQRLFGGKPLILRLALAAVMLLAIAALSLILPRAVLTPGGISWLHSLQPAFAATEGYLLVFDFGNVGMDSVQAKVEQLTEAVRAFKKAHDMPQVAQEGRAMICVTEEQQSTHVSGQAEDHASAGGDAAGGKTNGRVIVALSLPDDKLLEDLKAELSKIEGLPTPQITDATWFSEQGLPLPGDDATKIMLDMGHGQHAFNFPKDATPEEMEQAINDWLKQAHPDKNFSVQVQKSDEGEKHRIEVRIKGDADATAGEAGSPQLNVENAGDEIKLTLSFGDISHTFTFAKSASEQQISEEITAWLAQNYPEHKVNVDVTKTEVDGKTQLQVRIEKIETGKTDAAAGK